LKEISVFLKSFFTLGCLRQSSAVGVQKNQLQHGERITAEFQFSGFLQCVGLLIAYSYNWSFGKTLVSSVWVSSKVDYMNQYVINKFILETCIKIYQNPFINWV